MHEVNEDALEEKGPVKGPDVSRRLYGGILDYDAAGLYPGLELLNLIFCAEGNDLLPDSPEVRIKRRSQDFARKLAWDSNFAADPRRMSVTLAEEPAEIALRSVLQCLQLDIPNLSKDPTWERAHFFPYTHSLIHWDARGGKNKSLDISKVSIERRYLRGGGAYAFKVLRLDHDRARLERCRQGFAALYKVTGESPLEELAKFLDRHGKSDTEAQIDEIEKSSSLIGDNLEDLYRDGIVSILEQEAVTTVARIRAVIGWTAMMLILMQHRRSSVRLGIYPEPIICDCGGASSQLRRASQRCLKDILNRILDAVDSEARLPDKRRNAIRSFFWASAATIGLLNSWRGRRHFTFGVDTLEMIVMATVPAGKELPFENFVHDILYERLGLAVGRKAAESADLLSTIDASIFEENEGQLALQMNAAGLLTQYSDATRMVSVRGLL